MKETAVKALNSISFAKQHLRERVTTVNGTPARKKLDRAMELLSEAERIIEDAEEIECPPGETDLMDCSSQSGHTTACVAEGSRRSRSSADGQSRM